MLDSIISKRARFMIDTKKCVTVTRDTEINFVLYVFPLF